MLQTKQTQPNALPELDSYSVGHRVCQWREDRSAGKGGQEMEGTQFSLAQPEPGKKPSWMCRGDLRRSRRVWKAVGGTFRTAAPGGIKSSSSPG